MRKYQILLTLLLITGYLLLSYFDYESYRDFREAKLSDANLTIVNIKENISINSNNLYHSNFKLWDLEINIILEERRKKEEIFGLEQLRASKFHANGSSSDKESVANINLNKRKICLNQKCWEFMGMLTMGNQTEVTLLSTDVKPKLETFSVGDELLKGLIIIKIRGDNMVLIHKKDKRRFVLKLFDVDALDYLPKVKKEFNE